MRPDKKLEACTPEALQKAMREKEEQEAKIKAAHKEKAEHQRALEEARGRLAALDDKEQEMKSLRLARQEAIAKGRDHADSTARIEASERELNEMAKGRSLLEDQAAAYLKASQGCDDYLEALAADLAEHEREVIRIKAGVLANAYNEAAGKMADIVRELRLLCFWRGSYAFDEAPKPQGGYWGGGSLARIPVLRMDWDGVPTEDAYFMCF